MVAVRPPRSSPSFGKSYTDISADLDRLRRDMGGYQKVGQPVTNARFEKASLPDASKYQGATVYVTDASPNPAPAYSNGTDWIDMLTGSPVA